MVLFLVGHHRHRPTEGCTTVTACGEGVSKLGFIKRATTEAHKAGEEGPYKSPSKKMMLNAIFWASGSCTLHMMGIGISHTAKSVTMLTME